MYRLRVNGVEHDVDVEEDTPLLWAIRDAIGLTGTKYGCGIEQCWACTIWIDGEATKSCEKDVTEGVGRDITTIEGLGAGGLHPLQQAWIDHQVPQCGFCQSGMLMAAAGRMRADGGSTAEVVGELGNICVCGTQQRVVEALDSLR